MNHCQDVIIVLKEGLLLCWISLSLRKFCFICGHVGPYEFGMVIADPVVCSPIFLSSEQQTSQKRRDSAQEKKANQNHFTDSMSSPQRQSIERSISLAETFLCVAAARGILVISSRGIPLPH
jgi:hypothetical protein